MKKILSLSALLAISAATPIFACHCTDEPCEKKAKATCADPCEKECPEGKKVALVAAESDCKTPCGKATAVVKAECTESPCSDKAAKTVGAGSDCKKSCDDSECCPASKKTLSLVVAGLEDVSLTEKALKAVDGVKGAAVDKMCEQSGCFVVKYDAEQAQAAALLTAIKTSGLKVTAQKLDFKVEGLTCGGCTKTLSQQLAKIEGVKSVDKVCHASGHTALTIDPSITSEEKIASAINATKFKVAAAKDAQEITQG